jgi:hypothetical protein
MDEQYKPLLDLLKARDINPASQQITLMRHADPKYPLVKYIGTHALNLYQAMQPALPTGRPCMQVGSLLVSCYGHRPGHGLLLGIWRVRNIIEAGDAVDRGLLEGSFEPVHSGWTGHFFDLEELDLLDDLRLKLEIVWTGGERSRRRILRPTPQGLAAPYPSRQRTDPPVPFVSLGGASLVMGELKLALMDPAWQQQLGNVSGVYLIADERTGQQYVGSAGGAGGLRTRWASYAQCGHGGNKKLIALLSNAPGRESDFRFTLLEPMPLGTPLSEVVRRESYWKVALGSRTFGLNCN